MKRNTGVFNRGKKLVQRSALFFLTFMLVFGLIEPGIYHAYAESNSQKVFRTDYKLDPLLSQKPVTSTALTESGGTELEHPLTENARQYRYEDTTKRMSNTSTYVNNDGTKTLLYSQKQLNYKQGDKWEKIDNQLSAVENIAPAANLWQILTNTAPKVDAPSEYTGKAGQAAVAMKRSNEGISVAIANKTITMTPVGAAVAKPEKIDDTSVLYRDVWPGVDLQYELRGEAIKEAIIIKSKSAKTSFEFVFGGGSLKQHPEYEDKLTVDGLPDNYILGDLSVQLNDRGVISEQPMTQKIVDGKLVVSLDAKWHAALPESSFPIRIDPTLGPVNDQTDWMFKSDGYSCNGWTCWINTGSIYDNGWKSWRTLFQFPYPELAGKRIVNANMHGTFQPNANGDTNGRNIYMGHATCIGFNCTGIYIGNAWAGTDFDINFTNELNNTVASGDMGAVWSVWGEEGAYKSFKPYHYMTATVVYDTPTPVAPAVSPANAQVVVDTQPTLRVNAVTDADGDTVQYYFRVSTNPDAESGAVINSGWISSPQWTIPDGVLQDGTTYYWHVYTLGATQTNPNWTRNFKVDLRTGKDSTQSYDTVGPVGIDLATGNATMGMGTHGMKALGGTIGLNLSYNTPNRAKRGLSAEYWNLPANYSFASGAPSSAATVTRRDQNIDNNWSSGSPTPAIANDWFYARWTGQFVAPVTGTYNFGGSNDDTMRVWVNGAEQYNQNCYSGICYDTTKSISLTAGQTVPIRVEYLEAVGAANAKLYVKGAVPEQVVSSDWLYSDVVNSPLGYGLTGRYYTDNANAHDFDAAVADPFRLMMQRVDSSMTLNFGLNGPAQGLQADNFMARWTGYITVPAAGSYTLGATSDDGIRIKVNTGTWQTPLDSLVDHAGTYWGSAVSLPANTPIPIQVDWYDHGGGAQLNLQVQGNGYAAQSVPATWLTPDANVLPAQWKLGIDADGNVAYERLRVTTNSVILEDSTGSTHEYGYKNGGYTPPVNEDGTLSKNADNTYTFADTDGRTYVFNADGTLQSVSSPTDDRQPAALKYTYGGSPSRLLKIEDGTASARYGTVIYKGVNETNNICDKNGTNNPSALFGLISSFADAPSGKLCAFTTSDGDTTNFYYDSNGNLARIVQPGGQVTDYAYDQYGRITDVRDSVAADAIAAGIRAANNSVLATLTYDTLGRISSVKAPAATAAAQRLEHTLGYKLSSQLPVSRFYNLTTGDHRASIASNLPGYILEFTHGYIFKDSGTNLTPLYSCLVGTSNEMVSLDSNCEGTGILGRLGYAYDRTKPQPAGTVPLYRCRVGGEHFTSTQSNCDGYIFEFLLGYLSIGFDYQGIAELHIAGASEPSGYSKRIQYDTLLRTTTETDLTGKSVKTEWDSVKDLQLSKTDAIGMKSTTIYDVLDRATDSYGPAPSAWFGADRKPVAAQVNNVPHTSTGYDESDGMKGPAVSWYDVKGKTLTGAPRYNTTGFSSDLSRLWYDTNNHTQPITPSANMDGVGFRATAKLMTPPATGQYKLSVCYTDAIRVYVDSQLQFSQWDNRSTTVVCGYSGLFTLTAGTAPSLMIEAAKYGSRLAFSINLYRADNTLVSTASGVNDRWSPLGITAGYNLTTSTTAYDSQLGNVTSTTQYANPAYGTVGSTTLDPTGLNYVSQATYEAPGAGYLRQTSKTLPGGATTTYQHYGGTETADNPCTPETDPAPQAGMPKGKVDPTGRTTTTVYNHSGDVVATRYNSDPWTCTSYDARGRVTQTVVPYMNGKNGRTIANNYAVGGNPLVTSTTDDSGTITVENDLLGRTVKYTDAKNNVTTNTYDDFGKLTSRTSPIGTETYEYDQYDRLVKQRLDTVTMATVAYDEFSRIQSVQYPAGMSLQPAVRDALGRVSKVTYSVGGQNITDEITRSVSGLVLSGIENGVAKSYTYDKADRLTAATIGGYTFGYGYGTPDASCSSLPGNNANAAKDSNRTSYTLNGVATTYCYNTADQLIASSDARFTAPVYDSHGNTTSLGDATHKTEFGYDAVDRNMQIKEITSAGTRQTDYQRDVNDRIYHRTYTVNGTVQDDSYYGFTGRGDTPDFLTNTSGTITQKYLSLAGGIRVTIKPQSTSAGATTYSLSNLHGDTMATVNADGTPTIVAPTGPFGEQLANHTTPTNAAPGTSHDYLGTHAKATETDYLTRPIQMGARVYIPELGRFMQMDPVEGGTLNDYVYAQDPVNQRDLSGQVIQVLIIGFIVVAAIVAIVSIAAMLQPVTKNSSTALKIGNAAVQTMQILAPMGATSRGNTKSTSTTKATQTTTQKQVVTATTKAVEKVASSTPVHGNSLLSQRQTWGYKLYSNDGVFLKNGITSQTIPEKRYSSAFMQDKKMQNPILFENRYEAYSWEYEQNLIMPGPLNKNMH